MSGVVGHEPSFWRTVAGLPRSQDRKNVRRLPATVTEIAGAPPTQTARFLLPGETVTERPFFPVRGEVAVGESVFVEVNASGYIVVGRPGGGQGSGPTIKHRFRAHRTGSTQACVSGFNRVQYNAVAYDDSGAWSASAHEFTAPETGDYWFVASAYLTGLAAGVQVVLRASTNLQGIVHMPFRLVVENSVTTGAPFNIRLAAGEKVFFEQYANDADGFVVQPSTVETVVYGGMFSGGAGGGGVIDHGALSGRADDDHPQYHNDERGDARYYTLSETDQALAGKSDTGHLHDLRYVRTVNGTGPDANGNVSVSGGGAVVGLPSKNLLDYGPATDMGAAINNALATVSGPMRLHMDPQAAWESRTEGVINRDGVELIGPGRHGKIVGGVMGGSKVRLMANIVGSCIKVTAPQAYIDAGTNAVRGVTIRNISFDGNSRGFTVEAAIHLHRADQATLVDVDAERMNGRVLWTQRCVKSKFDRFDHYMCGASAKNAIHIDELGALYTQGCIFNSFTNEVSYGAAYVYISALNQDNRFNDFVFEAADTITESQQTYIRCYGSDNKFPGLSLNKYAQGTSNTIIPIEILGDQNQISDPEFSGVMPTHVFQIKGAANQLHDLVGRFGVVGTLRAVDVYGTRNEVYHVNVNGGLCVAFLAGATHNKARDGICYRLGAAAGAATTADSSGNTTNEINASSFKLVT